MNIDQDKFMAGLWTLIGLVILGLIFGLIGLFAIDHALPIMGYK